MGISQIPATTSSTWTQLATSSPSSVATVSFTSISTNYSKLLVTWKGLQLNADQVCQTRFNNDTGNNYAYQYQSIPSGLSYPTFSSSSSGLASSIQLVSLPASTYTSGSLLISGANDIYKTITYFSNSSNAVYVSNQGQGQWFSATAINRIDLFVSSTLFVAGTITLYGSN